MICKYITKRTYQRKPYIYCRKRKKVITFENCKKCSKFESRNYEVIKNKSKKLSKLEKKRFSILTNDLKHCFICNKEKDDLHEIYPGRNRLRSIKNGFVAPLCRQHHEDYEVQEYLKKYCQTIYEENHTREEFLKLIERSYLN